MQPSDEAANCEALRLRQLTTGLAPGFTVRTAYSHPPLTISSLTQLRITCLWLARIHVKVSHRLLLFLGRCEAQNYGARPGRPAEPLRKTRHREYAGGQQSLWDSETSVA